LALPYYELALKTAAARPVRPLAAERVARAPFLLTNDSIFFYIKKHLVVRPDAACQRAARAAGSI
jgi:hypothetical protein